MTPEQKMQAIVDKAGECWHDRIWKEIPAPNGYGVLAICRHCREEGRAETANPSPTDMNELFRLAEKLGYKGIGIAWDTEDWRAGVFSLDDDAEANAPTPVEALLNALYHAVTEQKS